MKNLCWLLGHKWTAASLSYYRFDPGKEGVRVVEKAKYCQRCGKLIVPNSGLYKGAVNI